MRNGQVRYGSTLRGLAAGELTWRTNVGTDRPDAPRAATCITAIMGRNAAPKQCRGCSSAPAAPIAHSAA